jgi:hypothetical protein
MNVAPRSVSTPTEAPFVPWTWTFVPQDDFVFPRHRQDLLDAIDHPLQPLLAVEARIPLPAQHAAHGTWPAQSPRDTDHFRLPFDRAFAPVRVGVGEVGRAAEHRHSEAGVVNSLTDLVQVGRIQAGEEAVVHLQAVGVEGAGHRDPVKYRQRAHAGNLVDVAFRKGRELQRHGASLFSGTRTNHCRTNGGSVPGAFAKAYGSA